MQLSTTQCVVVALCMLLISNVFANNCAWVSPSGKKYDLNGMKSAKGYSATNSGYQFTTNFCADVTPPASSCKGPGKAFQLFQQDTTLCYKLADGSDTGITITQITAGDDNSGLSVSYAPITDSDGYTRSVQVNVLCNKGVTADGFSFVKEDRNGQSSTYHFTINSKYACVGAKPSSGRHCALGCGFGVGGLLIVLSVVAIVLYFVIGTIVGKFVQKKEGLEIIPQFAFWKDIPFLLKDGVMLFVDLFRSVTNKGGYQEVSA